MKNARVRAAAIIIEDGRLLLIAHRKEGQVYWLLPGGGVDFGESLKEALRRELREELGIDADVGDIAFVCDSIDPDSRRHIINICFQCCCKRGTLSLGSEKRLYDFGFFAKKELRSMVIFPPIKKQLLSLLAGTPIKSIYLGKIWTNL
jgi:ADP-ribose pyrophosphatase YjhB (NUDIX family)